MKVIYVASPYMGEASLETNLALAKVGCDFVVKQGHGFFSPQLTYSKILEDSDPKTRKIALEIALTMVTRCDELWYFGENVSQAMSMEIEFAKGKGIPVRQISTEELKAEKEKSSVQVMTDRIPQMSVC